MTPENLLTEFDVFIIGTGLHESIFAACLGSGQRSFMLIQEAAMEGIGLVSAFQNCFPG